MPAPESSELKTYIEQLVALTQSGSMSWVQINPSTFVWDTNTPTRSRLSLQRLERQQQTIQQGHAVMKRFHHFVLQALEFQSGQQIPRFTITTQEDDELNPLLQTLFDAIVKVLSRQSLDFFKAIIPPKRD